ncbi:MAG: hypothetical protein WCF57_07915 [Pyrinomonadaceae bacterium]
MYVLIVEDDKVQYQFLKKALEDSASINVDVERISTEKGFRDKFPDIALNKPNVILMDIMLRWADPAPDLAPPPPEVKNDGFYRAGLRCERMLAGDERTNDIPVIIYSVLEYDDLGDERPQRPEVKYMDKDFDAKAIERMIREIAR